MSDSYKDGEVVWVKWRSVWWPGEVWDNTRVPEDILTSLRKPVIAFVKFFQEESFEFVRSPNNICQYNTDKKMEFIKKGMDKYRSNNKIMTNFPADVVKAEQLTKGNVNILSTLETPTKSKGNSSSSNILTPTTSDPARKSSIQVPLSMSLSTPSPVSAKKAVGSYNSSVKVQNTTSSVQKSNDKKLTCTMCNFATDRMNLLMMHIKNHSQTILSRVNSPSSSLDVRKSMISKISSRKLELDDGIAEDVRKIKESMKDPSLSPPTAPVTSNKKTRTPASTAKSTPKLKQSRQTRKDRNKSDKVVEKEDDKAILLTKGEDIAKVVDDEKNDKPKVNTCELKNELLADWLDDEDVKVEENKPENNEVIKSPAKVIESPVKSVEKVTVEASRSIRNIPKKQRVSEMYIQPEIPEKVELSNSVKKVVEEQPKPVLKQQQPEETSKNEEITSTTTTEMNKKSQQKASKRKHVASDSSNEPEKKKMSEESDDKILMATAELLNETEVPKLSNVQSSSFHSNDIDKRNLPPKERNKRIFRAKNSPETVSIPLQVTNVATAVVVEKPISSTENESKTIIDDKNDSIAGLGGTTTTIIDDVQLPPTIINNKNDRQELILPHKKKQSSRLLTASPIQDVKSNVETVTTSLRTKKNRKSSDTQKSIENAAIEEIKAIQSPLREAANSNDIKTVAKCECDTTTTTTTATLISENINRGQKRQHSKDSQSDDSISKLQPDTKKLHKLTDPPRTLKACSSETICITSKGTLSVARRDSIKTTCANSVVVTSQVIISEATKLPIVSTNVSTITPTETISSSTNSPKSSISSTITLSPQTLKNALKIPEEKQEEMKKQGLLTIENNRPKLTPKGRQKFKEFQTKNENSLSGTSSFSSITSTTSSSALNSTCSTTSICSTDDGKESESSQDEKAMVIDEDEKPADKATNELLESEKLDPESEKQELEPEKLDTESEKEHSEPSKSIEEELKPVSKNIDDIEMQSIKDDDKVENLSTKLDVDIEMDSSEPQSEIKAEKHDEKVEETQTKINDNNISVKETQQDKEETKIKVIESNGSELDDCNDEDVKLESTKQAESDNKTEIVECHVKDDKIPNEDVQEVEKDEKSVIECKEVKIDETEVVKEPEVKNEEIKIEESTKVEPEVTKTKVNDSKVDENSSQPESNNSQDSQKSEDLSTSYTSSSIVTTTTTDSVDTDSQSDLKKKPIENGNDEEEEETEEIDDREVDGEAIETSIDDPNSGSTGLIALQAETFGGPPNCFYLCRQIDDRYEPVDNQILVLNGQNALVPYDGISDLGLASTETSQESLTALSQLSPNSNIIINTPNGQKIELNHLTIMALHEQADENGIASIELSGEQIELNINAILEALASQQDVTETNDSILPGAVLLESADGSLIIDSEIPLDVHHASSVATQVSETLSKPIMSTTIAPEIAINPTKSTISENSVTRMLNIEDSLASIGVTPTRANVPKSLELPITVTNPTITETVNHRKLAASLGTDIVTETFVVQQSTDNGSDD